MTIAARLASLGLIEVRSRYLPPDPKSQTILNKRGQLVLEVSRQFFEKNSYLSGLFFQQNIYYSGLLLGSITDEEGEETVNPLPLDRVYIPAEKAEDIRRVSELVERSILDPDSLSLDVVEKNLLEIWKYHPEILGNELVKCSGSLKHLVKFAEVFGNQFFDPNKLGEAFFRASQKSDTLKLFLNIFEDHLQKLPTRYLEEALIFNSRNSDDLSQEALRLLIVTFNDRLRNFFSPPSLRETVSSLTENLNDLRLLLIKFKDRVEQSISQFIKDPKLIERIKGDLSAPIKAIVSLDCFIEGCAKRIERLPQGKESLSQDLSYAFHRFEKLARSIDDFKNNSLYEGIGAGDLEDFSTSFSKFLRSIGLSLNILDYRLKQISDDCLREILIRAYSNEETLQLFHETFDNRLEHLSTHNLGLALNQAASMNRETLTLALETFKENPNLQHISAQHLGVILSCASRNTEALTLFLETFKENPNLQQISVDHLGTTLASASSNREILQLFLVTFNSRLGEIPLNHLEAAFASASRTQRSLELFLVTFNDRLPQIRDHYLGAAFVSACSNRDALQLFLHRLDNRLNEISSDHLGAGMALVSRVCFTEDLESFFIKFNGRLGEISSEHLGSALVPILLRGNERLLFDNFRENANLQRIAANDLAKGLAIVCSDRERLQLFLSRFNENPNLQRIPTDQLEKHLEILSNERFYDEMTFKLFTDSFWSQFTTSQKIEATLILKIPVITRRFVEAVTLGLIFYFLLKDLV